MNFPFFSAVLNCKEEAKIFIPFVLDFPLNFSTKEIETFYEFS